MTERKITNLPASIRQRLLQVAQASNRPCQEVLQYYAMERFLFRLSVSPHVERFILKGALMMTAWGASAPRPTRDIDLFGYLPNHVESLVEIIREVCHQEIEPDALRFDQALQPPASATMFLRVALRRLHPDDENLVVQCTLRIGSSHSRPYSFIRPRHLNPGVETISTPGFLMRRS